MTSIHKNLESLPDRFRKVLGSFTDKEWDITDLKEDLEASKKRHEKIASGNFTDEEACDFVVQHPMAWQFMERVSLNCGEALFDWGRTPEVLRTSPGDEWGNWFMEFGPVDLHGNGEVDYLDMGITSFGNTIEDLYRVMAINISRTYTWYGDWIEGKDTYRTLEDYRNHNPAEKPSWMKEN